MSARDELARIIMSPESFDGGPVSCGPNSVYAARTAAAVLAAGYRKARTITTAEELDALPEGSVILSSGGDSAQKDGVGYWYLWGGDIGLESAEVALPAMVLHEPEATK